MAERLSTGLVNALNTVGCVKDVMANFTIHIFSGPQPASADLAETGTLLMKLTESGGAFVSGSAANGLNFGESVDGVLSKEESETWQGVGESEADDGTVAGWFRAYANTVVAGDSTTAIRFDGLIGTTSAFEMQMANPIIANAVPAIVQNFTYTTPKQ